jgi:hypothetical protein
LIEPHNTQARHAKTYLNQGIYKTEEKFLRQGDAKDKLNIDNVLAKIYKVEFNVFIYIRLRRLGDFK